ncbi:hypothetical protein HNR42_001253 [Deinobacterium chartae]|uniref:Nucleotidyltransferase domain-containing protein n=1 Tax=Deinobacterium chartae TaxID=521158 RepID=A0A841I053_9DEIO|nr:nucleotidyltransferase domain-containing protein [Deinobacterium chartae]MBB6097830.1 hypothetical protein [Deinobacterium chartae]
MNASGSPRPLTGTEAAELLDRARTLARELSALAGVAAVTLGGSLARGTGHTDSNLDLGLYYDPAAPPDLGALRAWARARVDPPLEARLTGYGGWGPWINGGGWLTIAGQRVDLLYRDLARVREAVDEALLGRLSHHHQPGHPFGFTPLIYLGELAEGQVLEERGGVLRAWRARLTPYPEALRRAVVGTYLWQAGFALDIAPKAAARGDAAYVAGCAYQCVMCLTVVLFALNGRHYLNEKGALRELRSFGRVPPGFAEEATALLGHLGSTPAELAVSLERLRAWLDWTVAEAH